MSWVVVGAIGEGTATLFSCPPEVIAPCDAPLPSFTTAVNPPGNVGAVNARFPVSLKSMTVRSTVKFPVNDAACTTATETSGGCPVLPDWTETPDRLVTRSE